MDDFTSKICDVCGGALTAYGSKKLKDGVLCRYCKKKMSEWIGDEALAEMSAEDVKAHLEYRAKNQEELEGFIPEFVAGEKYKLYVDSAKESFLISRKKDFKTANADLLKLSAIKEIRLYTSIDEDQKLGDVMFDIDMEEGEIEKLSFRVNEFPGLDIGSEEYNEAKKTALDMAQLFKDCGIDEERIVIGYGE